MTKRVCDLVKEVNSLEQQIEELNGQLKKAKSDLSFEQQKDSKLSVIRPFVGTWIVEYGPTVYNFTSPDTFFVFLKRYAEDGDTESLKVNFRSDIIESLTNEEIESIYHLVTQKCSSCCKTGVKLYCRGRDFCSDPNGKMTKGFCCVCYDSQLHNDVERILIGKVSESSYKIPVNNDLLYLNWSGVCRTLPDNKKE